MADTVLTVIDPVTRQQIQLRMHDNGDGTFSPASYGAATIADGADVAQGAIADAIVAAGAAGSLSAKLRRATQGLEDLKSLISLAAGENHLGAVGGESALLIPTITVTAAAYSVGNSIGGKITLTNAVRVAAGRAVLQSLMVLDRANQKAAFDLLIFNADPTNATLTDKTGFVFSTDDLKCIARVPVLASDYTTINAKAVANLGGLGRLLKAASGTSLFAAVVTSGTPTFAATTDFQLGFGLLQD